MDSPQTATVINEAQIAEWKKKHGDVFLISVEDKQCYVKKPTRAQLGRATTHMKANPIKFAEILLGDIWLGGDEELKTEDAYFMGVAQSLDELIEIKEATLKKL